MVLCRLTIGGQLGMRLLGAGDIVSSDGATPPTVVTESDCRAVAGARLALLGREFLLGVRHWPMLVAGIQLRCAQQSERLAAQLVICQLPRVDDRLLALMWLLAESWGRVTPSGTTLPLRLTHDALGALVGARRPTITLALRELTERGAIVRQDQGWLLVEPPPEATGPPESVRSPAVIEDTPTSWKQRHNHDVETTGVDDLANSIGALRATLAVLHEEHGKNRDEFTAHLSEFAGIRKRARATRERIIRERLSRQRTPSS
jgi:CRP-like cAMP-binding protein